MSDPYLPDGVTGKMVDDWYDALGPEPPEFEPEPCVYCSRMDCDEVLKGEHACCCCGDGSTLCGPCQTRRLMEESA